MNVTSQTNNTSLFCFVLFFYGVPFLENPMKINTVVLMRSLVGRV